MDKCEHKRLWIAIGKCRDCGMVFIAQDAEITPLSARLTSEGIQITNKGRLVLQEISLGEIRRMKAADKEGL